MQVLVQLEHALNMLEFFYAFYMFEYSHVFACNMNMLILSCVYTGPAWVPMDVYFFTITYRPSRHPAGTYALPVLRLRRFREAQARKAALARDRQGESELTPKMQPGRACLVLAFLSFELLEVASSRFARRPLSYLISKNI